MPYQLGYCTNVHAGAGLQATWKNLREHALEVKRAFCPQSPLGIGLWLSQQAAEELQDPGRCDEFRDWLTEFQLLPFTLNGFPYGDFHQAVVKHAVYQPTWYDPLRVAYTSALIQILHRLLPAGQVGSISTLPLCWGTPKPSADRLACAADNLRTIVDQLAVLEDQEGRLVYLCLEPEPGCALQRSQDVVAFFEKYLLTSADESQIRRYVRVCHDICHAAVMFEDQADALQRYRAAGIRLGKLQVSSSVVLPLYEMRPEQRQLAREQLADFAEDRYLHQTVVALQVTGQHWFFEDLPAALNWLGHQASQEFEVRVHFHVPIYLDSFGLLETSRSEIDHCWQGVHGDPDLQHLEVETYAWGVLPPELRQPRLSEGIAQELRWFSDRYLTH
jgi:hypothetical protein